MLAAKRKVPKQGEMIEARQKYHPNLVDYIWITEEATSTTSEVRAWDEMVNDLKKTFNWFYSAIASPSKAPWDHLSDKYQKFMEVRDIYVRNGWLFMGEFTPQDSDKNLIMDSEIKRITGYKEQFYCKSTMNFASGVQYSVGNKVVISGFHQYPRKSEFDFTEQRDPIEWHLSAIIFGAEGSNKITRSPEPVFLVSALDGTQYAPTKLVETKDGKEVFVDDLTEPDEVITTYPRWKFITPSKVKYMVHEKMEPTRSETKKLVDVALQGTLRDPEDPRPEVEVKAPPKKEPVVKEDKEPKKPKKTSTKKRPAETPLATMSAPSPKKVAMTPSIVKEYKEKNKLLSDKVEDYEHEIDELNQDLKSLKAKYQQKVEERQVMLNDLYKFEAVVKEFKLERETAFFNRPDKKNPKTFQGFVPRHILAHWTKDEISGVNGDD